MTHLVKIYLFIMALTIALPAGAAVMISTVSINAACSVFADKDAKEEEKKGDEEEEPDCE